MHAKILLLAHIAYLTVSAAPLGDNIMAELAMDARDRPPPPGGCKDNFKSSVTSMHKWQDKPRLVQGATYDANPGGSAGFTESWSVGVSVGYSIGGGITANSNIEGAIAQAAGNFAPTYTYSKIDTKGTSGTVTCPTNNGHSKITWGLQAMPWMYALDGTVTHQIASLTGRCDGPKTTAPFHADVPATQTGADQGSGAEIEFQCCVVSGGPVDGSPDCPSMS